MNNLNNQKREIKEIMNRRRQAFNERAQMRFGGDVNEMRNDNDDDVVNRNRMMRDYIDQQRLQGIRNLENNKNFMDTIDAGYFLNNNSLVPASSEEGISKMNADGNVNEELMEEEKINKKNLKDKALELETFIVERLARNRYDDAKKLFNILERMYRKFKDDNVKDVYFRVLQSLPRNFDTKQNIYSYRRDKNNFREVLKNMNISNRVKAMNEENPCVNSMGDMWDECDLNLCSDKCRQNILKASRESQKMECAKLTTGYDTENDKPIKMQEDIKKLVLERLNFCKRVSDFKRENPNSITYKDDIDIKNNIIKEIREFSNLINIHYMDCYTLAAEHVNTDNQTKEIIKLLKEIDYSTLSLERLTELRNFLQLMPSCDKLRYEEQQEKREQNIKEGERVGKFIIPKDTDYYKQIQGKEKARIYKDIASEKQYLYDPYSKTITGIQYPMTSETLLNKNLQDDSFVIPALSDGVMANSYDEELKLTPALTPKPTESDLNNKSNENNNISEAPVITPVQNSIAPTVSNVEKIAEEKEEEEKIIFNLTLKDLLEYMFLILVIVVILFVFGILL